MIRTLSLFSGIGGFDLGLKRTGRFRTVGYCEIEPFCQEVLQARMRDGSLDTAPICTDVAKLDGEPWRGRVDLVCGGFPCQDISVAGKQAGIEGAKSGLWSHMYRVICEVRPRYVLVENVAALLERGMDRVLGDLSECGFDAEWSVISACSVGAPHLRSRVFVMAYPHDYRLEATGARRNDAAVLAGAEASDGAGLQVRRGLWSESPSRFVGMADGVSYYVVRRQLTALGNAIVPEVAERVGQEFLRRVRVDAVQRV